MGALPRIPPTQLVDCSYSADKKSDRTPPRIPPTQLVDCSYSAYKNGRPNASRILPTQLVGCSYSAYKNSRPNASPNPTNAVGGLFIFSLTAAAILSIAFGQGGYELFTNCVGGIREKRGRCSRSV